MLELSRWSQVPKQEKKKLQELFKHFNQNSGFMANLRSHTLPKVHLESDGRGGKVAVASQSIPKGALVFYTDGKVLVVSSNSMPLEKLKVDPRLTRGGVLANMELEVKQNHSRTMTAVHELYPSNMAFYADNACAEKGNLTFVNTTLAKGKSAMSVSSWYAKSVIAKGSRLSFNYYHTKKRGHKTRDSMVQCDCKPHCKNWLFAMKHPSKRSSEAAEFTITK